MSDVSAPLPLPEWIYKRDGRLAPFDADRISRTLFAATEELGQPDSFLARELAGSVLHFLAIEAEGTTPTTTQLADLAFKVVRELGHPHLAEHLAAAGRKKLARPPDAVMPFDRMLAELAPGENSLALVRRHGTANAVPSFLRAAFGRDVQWTHAQGLLTLHGLEAPLEMAGWQPGNPGGTRLVEYVEAARGVAGGYIAIDGLDHLPRGESAGPKAAEVVRELNIGLRATGLRAVVNLNSAAPPPWAASLAAGPLFGEQAVPAPRADELRELLLRDNPERRLRVDWHLGERDFTAPGRLQLPRLVRQALEGDALAFAFGRPRRPMPLAEGITRQHPAVLLTVELQLARLLASIERQTPNQACSVELYIRKLGTLARLALSAGLEKRSFLRRLNCNWPAFLLDRARLLVVPMEMERAARRLVAAGGPSLAPMEIAEQIVEHLAKVLRQEGRRCHLETSIDAGWFGANGTSAASWDAALPPLQQLKAAATLHKSGGPGAATLFIDANKTFQGEAAVELLHWAWQHTELARLRFVRAAADMQQLTASWEIERTEE